MPNFMRLDLFPALVTVTSNSGDPVQYTQSRFVATDEGAYVFVDGRPKPTVADEGRLDDFTESPRGVWHAVLDDGRTFTVSRSDWCGCGSMLRGINPFPGVPYNARTLP